MRAKTVRQGVRRSARTADKSTRERVTRSAIELFAERGFHGTGIRDIATAAGLTTSTLYHYMRNKDDLLVEVMVSAITPLKVAADRLAVAVTDPAARLAVLVEQHVWVHASDRLATLVTDTELRALKGAQLKQVVALRDAYEAAWRTAVESGVAAGVFKVEHPRLAARALLEMSAGVSHWFSPKGALDLDTLCRLYADWALSMVRAESRPGAPIRRADLDLPAPDHFLPSAQETEA